MLGLPVGRLQLLGFLEWAVSIIAAHRRQWLEVRRQRKERSVLLLPATLWQLLKVVANSCRTVGCGVIPVSST